MTIKSKGIHHMPGNMNRRAFLGTGVAGAAAYTALGSSAAAAQSVAEPRKGGTLRIGLSGGSSTDSLDPALFSNKLTEIFGRQWGEQLVRVSPRGELIPAIASEWDSSPDARKWTFRIRQGVEFHNGATLTPDDVVATIERHSDEESRSGALGLLKDIESARREGDSVIIELRNPNADLPYLMSDYHLPIQQNGGKDNPEDGISAGPYKVTFNEPGVLHVCEKFTNHWNADEWGNVDAIEFYVMNDNTSRMAALRSGQVDMINRVEPMLVEELENVPGITVHKTAGKGHYLFLMHCDTAPFDNNDLRLALKYALDRQELIDKVANGYATIGNDTQINAAYPLFSDDIEQRPFDLDRARFHYEKSGHDGPILLRTAETAFPGAISAAELFQQTCARAGIPIELQREPDDGYWSQVWNNKPFCASYGSGRPTQDQLFTTLYLSSAEWNDTKFRRPDLDEMIIRARGELNTDRRKALYRDMNIILQDEGGTILPMFNNYLEATGPRVRGWVEDGTNELGGSYAPSRVWLDD